MNDVQPDPETSREMQAEQVRHLMALLAPGTPIREGLDRIVNGRTGGLIVLGDGPEINGVCSGGFPLTSGSPRRPCASYPRWTGASGLE